MGWRRQSGNVFEIPCLIFYFCTMTIQELEDFFRTHPVPTNTQLNAAATIGNPQKFLEVNLAVVREWDRDLDKCPSYWHLCELANVISGETGPTDNE
ncbi:DUF6965 family protein [Parapedobacter indicus]|uniref:DUF6965 domain-containing protein n=1 Tax=Parapedobacter indicus TaxID=1477437 RepID=A0A1I3IAZ4_9SPHI|nr:hypothetical protein [Parapedobacter indicus]PPL02086.1 hypothetical protein CLV26_10411 [Parapedobacter indicus]SFI45020.1 hypothetical protein SAMN05444682_10411 [Parapedobacter indicus]